MYISVPFSGVVLGLWAVVTIYWYLPVSPRRLLPRHRHLCIGISSLLYQQEAS